MEATKVFRVESSSLKLGKQLCSAEGLLQSLRLLEHILSRIFSPLPDCSASELGALLPTIAAEWLVWFSGPQGLIPRESIRRAIWVKGFHGSVVRASSGSTSEY